MLFNSKEHAHIPILLYDGDGIRIFNAIEIDTVTGMGLCFLDLENPELWQRVKVSSVSRYVGSSLVECECQWRLPIKVTSFSGYELTDTTQVMIAIGFYELKKTINSKFDTLAKHQNRTFQRLKTDFFS